MSKSTCHALVLVVLFLIATSALGAQGNNPFVGRWALTIPGGGAGWLGVTQENGYLDASLLWGGGSVLPVDSVFVNGRRPVCRPALTRWSARTRQARWSARRCSRM